MIPGKNLKRYYILLIGCFLVGLLYYLVITLPLIRAEKELDERLEDAVGRLASVGHGMTPEDVAAKVEILERDIEAFTAISGDGSRTIQFSPEVEESLGEPFLQFEFDHNKFIVVDRIRRLIREREVEIFDNWERKLPVPENQQPYLLWAQLAVTDQIIRTAIKGGAQRIDDFELVSTSSSESQAEVRELEVSIRMQLTGPMEAIHSILMMLPLNGEELEDLKMDGVANPKSSFFLSRFILKKSAKDDPEEVSLEFVASGFVEADQAF